MKTLMTWLFAMVFVFADAFGQTPSLLLVNKETGATKTIPEGRKVGVTTLYGKYVSGPMTIVNDSVVEIKQVSYGFDEILSVRGKTREATTSGAIVTGAGAAILVAGLAIGLTNTEPDNIVGLLEQETVWVTGGLMAGAGLAITATGIVIMSSPKTFSSAYWAFHIER